MDENVASMTPDRNLHMKENPWDDGWGDTKQVYWHLLKFHEIMDASLELLPKLQKIALRFHVWDGDKWVVTFVKAAKTNGMLQVNQRDVNIGFWPMFEAGDGFDW
jgi:hypothetical protein